MTRSSEKLHIREAAREVKADFREMMGMQWRVHKPSLQEKSDIHAYEAYKSAVPLLKEVHPEIAEIITEHFNRLVDLFKDYYCKPRLFRADMAKRSSAILNSLNILLELHAPEVNPAYGFDPREQWQSVYWEACSRFALKTELRPMRHRSELNIG